MTLQGLLNADISEVGRWVRRGLAWWGRELSACVPPALRDRRVRSARALAAVSADGSVRLWEDGGPGRRIDRAEGALRRVDLLLAPGAALVRELELPRLPVSDLRRLLEVNLDRYTPFKAEEVYFDVTVLEQGAGEGRQRIRLGLIRRERGRAILAGVSELGLKVERMGPPPIPPAGALQLDFMRAIREQEGGDPTGLRRAYLWTACGVATAVCVAIAVIRDTGDIDQLQSLVDAQQPGVALALHLRGEVERTRAQRVDLLTLRSSHEPLRIVDAATRNLPPPAWVQRLEWNGRSLRLVGVRPPGLDLDQAFHGPALAGVRSLLADMPTAGPAGLVPFDVVVSTPPAHGR